MICKLSRVVFYSLAVSFIFVFLDVLLCPAVVFHALWSKADMQ